MTHDTKGTRSVLLSADEKKLYVADGDIERGDTCQLFEYAVKPDGNTATSKALVTFMAVERGIEGMCLDSEGNILACAGWKKSGGGPGVYLILPSGTLPESHPPPAATPVR